MSTMLVSDAILSGTDVYIIFLSIFLLSGKNTIPSLGIEDADYLSQAAIRTETWAQKMMDHVETID